MGPLRNCLVRGVGLLTSTALLLTVPPRTQAGPLTGEMLFKDNCARCHSLRPNVSVSAPSLAGVVGRKAGTVAGFKHSEALRTSGIVWTPEKLDQWLADPHKLVAGEEMPFLGLKEAAQRAAVIDFLTQQKLPATPGKDR